MGVFGMWVDSRPYKEVWAVSLLISMFGGWIYAAESAGAHLPEGCLIDADGNPSTDPKAYFEGGAILPAAGQKGYALALAAELIAEALIGPVATEANWLLIMVDTTRMTAGHTLQERAEAIFASSVEHVAELKRLAEEALALEAEGLGEDAPEEAGDEALGLIPTDDAAVGDASELDDPAPAEGEKV